MKKETRPRLTDEATFTPHLRGNHVFVSAKAPTPWGTILKVGVGLAALAVVSFYMTPAHAGGSMAPDVRIIHVKPTNQTVRRVEINRHPSLHSRSMRINKHPSRYVTPLRPGRDIKARSARDNQNSFIVLD